MISKTQNGMKEGLSTLGLPVFPLEFIPGSSLKLCGHDVREEVNGMIHAWMTNDKDDFYRSLLQIKEIVAKPMLTEEEFQMMEAKHEWVKTRAQDGRIMYTTRDGVSPSQQMSQQDDEDDDDDEVIDVTPAGTPLPIAAKGAPAPQPSSATVGGTSADDEENYYSILDVDPQASLQEIRIKFRSLVVQHHPERGGDVKQFQKLNKAYSVLSDHRKRQEFDALLAGPVSGGYPSKFVD